MRFNKLQQSFNTSYLALHQHTQRSVLVEQQKPRQNSNTMQHMQWKETIHTGGIEVPQEDKIKSAFPIPCRYFFWIRRQAPRAYWLSVLLGLGMLSFECQTCRKSYIYSPCRTTSKAWFKVSKLTASPYIKHTIRDALNMFVSRGRLIIWQAMQNPLGNDPNFRGKRRTLGLELLLLPPPGSTP